MDISDWRKKIDEIDLQLVELLNERTRCSIEVGKWKRRHGHQLYDPAREREILQQVGRATRGPLEPDAMQRLFERIIDEARGAARLAAADDEQRREKDA